MGRTPTMRMRIAFTLDAEALSGGEWVRGGGWVGVFPLPPVLVHLKMSFPGG